MKLTKDDIFQLINCVRFSDWNCIDGFAKSKDREVNYVILNKIEANWKEYEQQLLQNQKLRELVEREFSLSVGSSGNILRQLLEDCKK